ncbi:MAG: rhodanese-like domain-containing protein [Coriobacteriia bacterium]|nr:rhodanese-like domain-containing protein [Coriobacteriia bacterium]
MGFLADLFTISSKNDINEGVEEFHKTPNALLVDVRYLKEFNEGHVPGAINIPLPELADRMQKELPNTDQDIFIYCRSGNRSKQAEKFLLARCYTHIHEIGGIKDFAGEVEKED